MARKKKSRGVKAEPTAPTGTEEFGNNPFANLAGLQKDARKSRRAADAERERVQAEEAARKASAKPQAAVQVPESAENLDDMDLFEQAMDTFEDDIYLGKFGRPGDLERSRKADPPKQKLNPLEREVSIFQQELGSVTPLAPGARLVDTKPRKRTLPETLEPRRASLSKDNTSRPSPVEEKSVSLHKGQQKLLDELRKRERQSGPVPTTTLRGLTKSVAVAQLEAFIETHHGRGNDLVRVITGKGRGSEGEPIIKHTTVGLLESDARVAMFTPEVNRDGNFGSVIVRLKTHRVL